MLGSRLLYLGCLGLVVGCGEAGPAEPPGLKDPWDPQNPAFCKSCNVPDVPDEEDPIYQQHIQSLDVRPGLLAFYGDADSARGLVTQQVGIANHTASVVMLSATYIAEDSAAMAHVGDQKYFQVAPLAQPLVLQPGKSQRLEVSFVPSTTERRATLIIETSHPAYGTLAVGLLGKYFLSSY